MNRVIKLTVLIGFLLLPWWFTTTQAQKALPKKTTSPAPLCIPPDMAERANVRYEESKNKPQAPSVPAKPKVTPTPAPLTPCNLTEQQISQWVDERLQKKYERIKSDPTAMKMYSREHASKLPEVMKILRAIEDEKGLEPGTLIYLAWAEGSFDKLAASGLSTARSWYQILWDTGIRMELIRPTGQVVNGYVCDIRNSKGNCLHYGKGSCNKIKDLRYDLPSSGRAIGKELAPIQKKYGKTYLYWWHHYPKAVTELPKIVAAQLNGGKYIAPEEVQGFLKSKGINNALRLTAAAVLCKGLASQKVSQYPDGSATYVYTIVATAKILREFQPQACAEIDKARTVWNSRH